MRYRNKIPHFEHNFKADKYASNIVICDESGKVLWNKGKL